jgi:hypothetical protein
MQGAAQMITAFLIAYIIYKAAKENLYSKL